MRHGKPKEGKVRESRDQLIWLYDVAIQYPYFKWSSRQTDKTLRYAALLYDFSTVFCLEQNTERAHRCLIQISSKSVKNCTYRLCSRHEHTEIAATCVRVVNQQRRRHSLSLRTTAAVDSTAKIQTASVVLLLYRTSLQTSISLCNYLFANRYSEQNSAHCAVPLRPYRMLAISRRYICNQYYDWWPQTRWRLQLVAR